MPATEPLWSRLESIGNALAMAFGLAGWFGVDFVLRDGIPWPVEVNPRYTASLEIFEIASGQSLLPDHRDACAATPSPGRPLAAATLPAGRVIAKWILHAPRRLVAPDNRSRAKWEARPMVHPVHRRHPLARHVL